MQSHDPPDPPAPLTDEQIDELVARLASSRDELRNQLRVSKDGARTVALSEPIGRLTRMDALQQQAMAKANRAAYDRRLRLVEAALQAVERGEYGSCRSCEEPVGYRRLKARPETPFCLDCQEERETCGVPLAVR